MITDEERREVAANIRNAANRRKDDLNDDPGYSPFAALSAMSCRITVFGLAALVIFGRFAVDAVTHLAVPQVAMINDMLEMVQ